MKSDYQYLFPESWNLWKVTSVGSDFLSPASLDKNSPFFKYILPMTPKIHKKINFFLSSFWRQNRVSKIVFFYFFFNCKKWQVRIKNVGVKEKIKYHLYYYLTHWWKKNFKKLIFSWATGCLDNFFWQITLFRHSPPFYRWWLVINTRSGW